MRGCSVPAGSVRARVLLTAVDWDLLARNSQSWKKPRRDMVVTDGERLTVGDTTLTFIHSRAYTGNHVHDISGEGRRQSSSRRTLGWDRVQLHDYRTPCLVLVRCLHLVRSKIPEAVANAGADVFLSNHPSWDDSNSKMAALARRAVGAPHPYVIGSKSLQSHLSIAEHCATAAKVRATSAS